MNKVRFYGFFLTLFAAVSLSGCSSGSSEDAGANSAPPPDVDISAEMEIPTDEGSPPGL